LKDDVRGKRSSEVEKKEEEEKAEGKGKEEEEKTPKKKKKKRQTKGERLAQEESNPEAEMELDWGNWRRVDAVLREKFARELGRETRGHREMKERELRRGPV